MRKPGKTVSKGVLKKTPKTVFVIMPFTKALTRKKVDLDSFFLNNLKEPIEREISLKHRYQVSRSDNTLDITEQIIRDIFDADVVICDLSGNTPNPNVMYELGLRFALCNKPVLLIREEHEKNEEIFDIRNLHTHSYSSLRYQELQVHLIKELKRLETIVFESPVLKLLEKQPVIAEALLVRQTRGMMHAIREGLYACQEILRRRVCKILGEINQPILSPGEWAVVDFFLDKAKELPEQFFVALDFSPPVVPGLLGYLTFGSWAEVLPSDLALSFGSDVHNFHFHYSAYGVLKEQPTLQSYSAFVLDLVRVHRCAVLFEGYLTVTTEFERASIRDMLTAELKRN